MKHIDKDTTIGECLQIDSSLGEIFMGFGMHCLSCPMSQMETIEEACQVHGIEVDFMLKKLNEHLEFCVPGSLKSTKKVKRCKKC